LIIFSCICYAYTNKTEGDISNASRLHGNVKQLDGVICLIVSSEYRRGYYVNRRETTLIINESESM